MVDESAYAKAKRIIKLYNDIPDISRLIKEYGINPQNGGSQKSRRSKEQISEVKAILEELGRMPKFKEEPTLYSKVRYVLQTYKDNDEVKKLRYKYVFGKDILPIKDTKYPIRPSSEYKGSVVLNIENRWKRMVSMEYIEYTVRNFGFIPVQESVPMIRFKKYLDLCSKALYDKGVDSIKSLQTWLQSLYDLNCRDPFILGLLNFFEFCKQETQAKVRDLLIENGCCCAGYIWRQLFPESIMPIGFFNNFYRKYICQDKDFMDIKPLGRFVISNNEMSPLYVHFRDSHLCNKELIYKRARPYQYRDWNNQPPQSLEEWRAYGNLLFFRKNYDGFLEDNQINWTDSVIDYSLREGHPYFQYWQNKYFYLDFFVFLLENDYPLDEMLEGKYTNYRIQESLMCSFDSKYYDSRVEGLRLKAIALLEEKGIDFMDYRSMKKIYGSTR